MARLTSLLVFCLGSALSVGCDSLEHHAQDGGAPREDAGQAADGSTDGGGTLPDDGGPGREDGGQIDDGGPIHDAGGDHDGGEPGPDAGDGGGTPDGGGPPVCDCAEQVCATVSCSPTGECVAEPWPLGTPPRAGLDVAGDCLEKVCDGAGAVVERPADDPPSWSSECAPLHCADGHVVTGEAAPGTPCAGGVCFAGACIADLCATGGRDGLETDVDCGGPECDACSAGARCELARDCASGVCSDGVCAEPSCEDGVRNGAESAVDCAGACAPCAPGATCGRSDDCGSGVCTQSVCAAPTCADRVQNGLESAVDCGGADCGKCADGMGCQVARDCASGVCEDEACQPAACDDGVRNQGESDVDCGGPCAGCPNGAACTSLADCSSRACIDGACTEPSCSDGQRNGDESGLDCGGSCDACSLGLSCDSERDCREPLACHHGRCALEELRLDGGFAVIKEDGAGLVHLDLDGDGWVDLAQRLYGAHGFEVVFGFDDLSFGERYLFGLPHMANDLAVLDLAGDGQRDLLIASGPDRGSVGALCVARGGRRALDIVQCLDDAPLQHLTVGDFDGDGLDDVAAASLADVRVYLAGADGELARTQVIEHAVSSLAVGDVDLDGDLDLLGATQNHHLLTFANDGSGALAAPVSVYTYSSRDAGLAVGQVSGSPHPELFVAADSATLHANARGDLTSFRVLQTTDLLDPFPLVHDLDANGHADLLAPTLSVRTEHRVSLWPNDGTSLGERRTLFHMGSFMRGLGLVDLDRDCRADLVTSHQADSFVLWPASGVMSFPQPRFSITGQDVAAGDVDGDGDPDLIGGGGSTRSLTLNRNQAGELVQRAYDANVPIDVVAVADLDSDGRDDVVTGSAMQSSGYVTTWLSSPDGTPVRQQQFQSCVRPVDLALADVDGDDRVDLVVACEGSGVLPPRLDVYLGDGAGRLTQLSRTFTSGTPRRIAIGRFGSGVGVAVVHAGATLSVYDDLAAASPTRRDYAIEGARMHGVAAADLDADGLSDVVISDAASSTVRALHNLGSGFALASELYAQIEPRDVALADLDGDSRLDILVANARTGSVSVRRAVGPLEFAYAADYHAVEGATAVATLDVDGDGRLDVVAGDTSAAILRNTSGVPPARGSCPTCGDGVRDTPESCDDGNTDPGDGCSASCTLEVGYRCELDGEPCAPICGDGLVRDEGCDDGNTLSGDGCAGCELESGHACADEPSACAPVCGDGLVAGSEICDVASDASCPRTCRQDLLARMVGQAEATHVAELPGGGVLVVGSLRAATNLGDGPRSPVGVADLFLVALDAGGQLLWTRQWGSAGATVQPVAALVSPGAIEVVGTFTGEPSLGGAPLANAGAEDTFVVRYDLTGAHLHSRAYGGEGSEQVRVARRVGDDLYLAGVFWGALDLAGESAPSAGQRDVFVARLDALGNPSWLVTLGDAQDQVVSDLDVGPDGRVAVAGEFRGSIRFGADEYANFDDTDLFVWLLDADSAATLEARVYQRPNLYETANAVRFLSTGDLVFAGSFEDTLDFGAGAVHATAARSLFLAHLTPELEPQRVQVFGVAGDSRLASLDVAPDDSLLLGGHTSGSLHLGGDVLASRGARDAWIAKLTPAGEHAWSYAFGGSADQTITAVHATEDAGAIATGAFWAQLSFGGPTFDASPFEQRFVARFAP